MQKCRECGKDFDLVIGSQKFCSDKCRQKHYRKKKSEQEKKLKAELAALRSAAESMLPSEVDKAFTQDVIKSVVKASGEAQEYSSQWFRNAFEEAKTGEELTSLVVLMQKKITGKWSQDQLKLAAQNIFDNKFNF